MDVYYPGNIAIRLILRWQARRQAEEGGVPDRAGFVAFRAPEHLQARGKPVRVKKTRQIGNLEPGFDSIETERALAASPGML
jgi:hypothetical protein